MNDQSAETESILQVAMRDSKLQLAFDKHPGLLKRLIDNERESAILHNIQKITEIYLSDSDRGFSAMMQFIALLEVPEDPKTGEKLRDQSGDFVMPYLDQNRRSLFGRFIGWIIHNFSSPEVEQELQQIRKKWLM
ncbi:MAG: hypothetical protein JWO13_2743 [Acidobacteriales bacterium]|nr:hypothetical protein [Terriglobales bacterium]